MIQINKKSNYTKYTRIFRASSSSCDPMSSTNKQILQNYRSENNWNTPKFNGAKSISISVTFGLCIPLWVNKWQMLIFLLSVCLCVSVFYPYLYHFDVLLILWETWFEIVYLHFYKSECHVFHLFSWCWVMTKREELFNWFVARNGTASHPKTAMVGKKWNLGTRYSQPKQPNQWAFCTYLGLELSMMYPGTISYKSYIMFQSFQWSQRKTFHLSQSNSNITGLSYTLIINNRLNKSPN